MEWIISNKRNKARLVVIVALVTFSTVFLLTGALMTAVFGLYPGDVGYHVNKDPLTGVPNTPYQDFMANACVSAPWYEGDKTVVLDTKGLEESGLIYYDPNYCFDVAKTIKGYVIDKVEPYGDDQMKITMVKKP
jgi:hypothetical protein